MSNEIKQGDKVRMSKDAPLLYTEGCIDWEAVESTVDRIDGDAAEIDYLNEDDDELFSTIIPTKYLVKVDAEAKEANVKIGDNVVVHYPSRDRIGRILKIMLDGTYDIDFGGGCTGHNITRSQIEPYTTPTIKVGDRVEELISRKSGIVLGIRGDIVVVGIPDDKEKHYRHIDSVELASPTELTEAQKKPYEGISEETANEISDKLEAYAKALSSIADSFDWQRYEADLAKEVALKVANKFYYPEQAAEYAVSVAKTVVEGLKRK